MKNLFFIIVFAVFLLSGELFAQVSSANCADKEKILRNRTGQTKAKLQEKDLIGIVGCYIEAKDYVASTRIIEEMYEAKFNLKKYHPHIVTIFQKLADEQLYAGDHQAAADTYKKLRKIVPTFKIHDVLELINTDECLSGDLASAVITNLGKNICSQWGEYAPIVSTDGKTIFFCRNATELNKKKYGKRKIPESANTGEDIWRSDLIDGKWTLAKKVADLNTKGSDVVLALFNNKTEVIIFRDRRFFRSVLSDKGTWGKAQPLGKPFNSRITKYFDINYSKDGKYLFYTAQKYGSVDLYVCEKETNGAWSDPIMLDSTINSSGRERTPQLAADGRTLYFSSDGHGGFGNLDVFRSVMGDNVRQWSKPVNLGRTINTSDEDWCFAVPASGDKAYYSSNYAANSEGGRDIYKVDLCEALRPEDPVVMISGRVVDGNDKPLIAKVIWEDLIENKKFGPLSTQPDGTFFLTLTLGKHYSWHAKKEGYYAEAKNIDLRDIESYNKKDVLKEGVIMKMVNMSALDTIRINVFFDYNSSELMKESTPELERLLSALTDYKELKIKVRGHTDSTGSGHKRLSTARARAVVNYLVKNGISKKRLKSVGMGCNEPICKENTDECLAKNRRVDIIFIK